VASLPELREAPPEVFAPPVVIESFVRQRFERNDLRHCPRELQVCDVVAGRSQEAWPQARSAKAGWGNIAQITAWYKVHTGYSALRRRR
jgi:hypothetical protein